MDAVLRNIGKLEQGDELVAVICVPNTHCPGRPVIVMRKEYPRQGGLNLPRQDGDPGAHYRYYARCSCGKGRSKRNPHMSASIEDALYLYLQKNYKKHIEFAETMARCYNRILVRQSERGEDSVGHRR